MRNRIKYLSIIIAVIYFLFGYLAFTQVSCLPTLWKLSAASFRHPNLVMTILELPKILFLIVPWILAVTIFLKAGLSAKLNWVAICILLISGGLLFYSFDRWITGIGPNALY